ncbi:MAG: ATP-binding cassette domain-containing protein [Clostridium sp.]
MLNLKNLKKEFNGRSILDIKEFTFKKGNIYALVGPNGCGKSTLLRIIGGLDSGYLGSIDYEGLGIEKYKSKLSYVHQKPYMFNFTVKKNIEMSGEIDKKSNINIEELIDVFGIRGILDLNAKRISGGEAQKVSFIRAIHQQSEILLLDEATSNMDSDSCRIFEEILLKNKQDKVIIIVTHNIFQALRIGDYLVEFDNGSLSQSLKAEALKRDSIKTLLEFTGNVNI